MIGQPFTLTKRRISVFPNAFLTDWSKFRIFEEAQTKLSLKIDLEKIGLGLTPLLVCALGEGSGPCF